MGMVARADEIRILNDFFSSNKAEFLAIYGRRRVGKTYLIGSYFKDKTCRFISMTGIEKASFLRQRTECCKRISEAFYNGTPLEVPRDWFRVFELIDNAVKNLVKNEKVVLFFDEFPWLVTPRANLLQALEYYWNNAWCHDKRIKLIVCGSLASWIIKHIINNTGGLYNRVTYRLKLEPFTLYETKAFLKSKKISLTNQQALALYMVTGGIPLYLEQARKGLSANQIIDQLCFNKNGLLVNEAKELFKSLFLDAETYLNITREIAKHRYGITKSELAKSLGIALGGRLVERLKELEDAGFIISFLPYQHREKGAYFRVIDEYTMFYFRWVEPHLSSIRRFAKAKGFWLEQARSNSYKSWCGYAFESICYKHISNVINKLSLKSSVLPYAWKHIPKKGDKDSGAQIDLLFDRDDHCITLCEIKYTEEPFVIDKQCAESLNKKAVVFKNAAKTDKQLFWAIISANGIKENIYSEEIIDGVVTLNDLFEE
jgi:uncharacterized protein